MPAPKLGDGARCGRCHRDLFDARPLEVDEAGFARHAQRDEIPLLVDFWAPWCGPCKMIGPFIEQLAEEYEGKIKVVKYNTQDSNQVAASLGVRSIPAVILFDGNEVVDAIIGARPKVAFDKMLSKYWKKFEKKMAKEEKKRAKEERKQAVA